MEAKNFDKSLRAFVARRPFRSFTIRFVDGTAITVDHPEAVMTRGGTAVYFDSKGQPTLFDHESVSHLSHPREAKSA
jgi:hypothetical protein